MKLAFRRSEMATFYASQLLFCMGLAVRNICDKWSQLTMGVQGSSEPSGPRFCCRICSRSLANGATEAPEAAAEPSAAAAEAAGEPAVASAVAENA